MYTYPSDIAYNSTTFYPHRHVYTKVCTRRARKHPAAATTRRARDRLALILRRLLKAKAHRRGYEVSTQTKGTHILASFHRVLVLVLVLSRVVVDATSGWVENPKTRVSRDARGTTTRDDDARDDDSRVECDRAPFRARVRSPSRRARRTARRRSRVMTTTETRATRGAVGRIETFV